MKVPIEIARFFMYQCVGSYSGHMASIPNNPVMQGIVLATLGGQNVDARMFSEFLIGMADALDADAAKKAKEKAEYNAALDSCPF